MDDIPENRNEACQDLVTSDSALMMAAEQGVMDAQYNIGCTYERSDGGVPQNIVKAAERFPRAAQQGYWRVQYSLGYLFYYGDGVPQDYTMAMELGITAAHEGLADAQHTAGNSSSKVTVLPGPS